MTKYDLRREKFPSGRKLFAFVSSVQLIETGKQQRYSIEFDAVDADVDGVQFSNLIEDTERVEPFALVRVSTTLQRFFRVAEKEPEFGDWFELELQHRPNEGVSAAHAQLGANGYLGVSRGTVRARFLFSGLEPRPRSLSAAVASRVDIASSIASRCDFPNGYESSDREIHEVLETNAKPFKIEVHDVGQASFVTARGADGSPMLHFDAGWPIFYNLKTAPKEFNPVFGSAPVILSHWDFDHLLLVHRYNLSLKRVWVVPPQPMGPGARRIVELIAKNGRVCGWTGANVNFNWGQLVRCTGPIETKNDSGLAAQVTLQSGRSILIAGDASYDAIPLPPYGWDGLIITHHGAKFRGNVPLPVASAGVGVISVGEGNVYRHPNPDAVRRHKNCGWSTKQTSEERKRGKNIISII